MTTEKPKLDWTKPLQTTDGNRDVKLLHILKDGSTYPVMTVIGDSYHTFTMEGRENIYSQSGIQLINTPETKLVKFVINNYDREVEMPSTRLYCHQKYADHDVALNGAYRINRINFSMQLEPGKNYEVTGVKEVQ